MCGGLPAPEVETGPIAYRCSWSPRGVLTAATQDAQFRLGGIDHTIAGADLLARTFADVSAVPTLTLDAVANRDSLAYAAPYGLPESVPTLMRGTLRYRGFCRQLDAFKAIGLLDQRSMASTPARGDGLVDAALARVLGLAAAQPTSRKSLVRQALARRQVAIDVDEVLDALAWCVRQPPSRRSCCRLGLDANSPVASGAAASPLDVFALVLGRRLSYRPGERDMVVMAHERALGWPLRPIR